MHGKVFYCRFVKHKRTKYINMEIENKPLATLLASKMEKLLKQKGIGLWDFSKIKTKARLEMGLPFSYRSLRYLNKGVLCLRGKKLKGAASILGINLEVNQTTTINIKIQ